MFVAPEAVADCSEGPLYSMARAAGPVSGAGHRALPARLDLAVAGHVAPLFRDERMRAGVEAGHGLIPLQCAPEVLADRHDCRHALESLPASSAASITRQSIDDRLEGERWRYLPMDAGGLGHLGAWRKAKRRRNCTRSLMVYMRLLLQTSRTQSLTCNFSKVLACLTSSTFEASLTSV